MPTRTSQCTCHHRRRSCAHGALAAALVFFLLLGGCTRGPSGDNGMLLAHRSAAEALGAQVPTMATWASSEATQSSFLAFGDVDGDGDLDLAVANYQQSNHLYESSESGLSGTVVWSSTDADDTFSVAFGDVDGDGDLDLAASNSSQSNVLYDNLGTILAVLPLWTSTATDNTYSVALGDVDNDGDLDLAAGNNLQSNRVYPNAAGVLSASSTWSCTELDATNDVAFGDISGDGDLDLVVSNAFASNRLYDNAGGGAFGLSGLWSSFESDDTYRVALGDVDGDGDLDLVAGNWGQENRLYANTGSALEVAALWSSLPAEDTRSVALGDVDGDGDLDLGTANYSQSNQLYGNSGAGLAAVAGWGSDEAHASNSIAFGDVTGNGDLDLAVANDAQPNYLYQNTGRQLAVGARWSSSESDSTNGVALGDVDGDGDLDLAAGNRGQSNRVYTYEGPGFSVSATWSSSETDFTESVAFGDVDGDGDLELAVGNYTQNNRLYENVGVVLATSAFWSSTEAEVSFAAALGDVDGDGDLDLAVGNFAANNRLYQNGAAGLSSSYVWSSADLDNTFGVTFGDTDSDGDLDLSAASFGHSTRLYANDGSQLVAASVWSSDEADDTQSVAFGDPNANGNLDLAAGNLAGSNRLYENGPLGFGTSAAWSSTETDDTSSVEFGDVHGDGLPELSVGNRLTPNRIYASSVAGLGAIAIWSGAESDDTRSVVFGDIDKDGDVDMVSGNWDGPVRLHGVEGSVSFGLPNSPGEAQAVPGFFVNIDPTAVAPRIHSEVILTSNPLVVSFTLVDAASDSVRQVKLDYSYNGGSWLAATISGAVTGLAASPAGVLHSVVWDTGQDCASGNEVRLRLRLVGEQRFGLPFPWQRASTWFVSSPFRTHVSQVVDADGDGFFGCHDCNESADSCTNNCYDADADGVMDCMDRCFDSDGDEYGLGEGRTVGAGTVTVAACTTDGASACVWANANCAGIDCDDGDANVHPGVVDSVCDNLDVDCDGTADEDYVSDATCGVGVCLTNNTPSTCTGGVEAACTPGMPTSLDDVTCDGVDDDCSGADDEDYVPDASCGVGYCSTGNTPSTCVGGGVVACEAGLPLAATDATCDAVDDDCDGVADDEYVADSSCGTGYCLDNNTPSSCVGGSELICEPSLPLNAIDATCDGVDDNCDGRTDNGFVIDDTCGQGYCLATNIPSKCSGGSVTPCAPGSPLGLTDESCDAIDGDCDGAADDDYLSDDSCGVGYCQASNVPSSCSGGVELDCFIGTASEVPERSCFDGSDNDCDGLTDSNDSDCAQGCVDPDLDTVCDPADNCALLPNVDQQDIDGDGEGDVCDDDDDGDGVPDTSDTCPMVYTEGAPTNPIAHAGLDVVSDELKVVTLDAAWSCLVNGVPTYAWSQVAGPVVDVGNFAVSKLTIVAPRVFATTDLTFELVVADDAGASPPATATVTVLNSVNEAPNADAGDDQVVRSGEVVALAADGSSDANDDTLSYTWSQTGGPLVVIAPGSVGAASFTAPDVLASRDFVLQLVAMDGLGGSSVDSMTVTVMPNGGPPVFTSFPSLEAMAHEPYHYDVNDVVEVGGELPITYSLADSPAGFAVDISGLVSWIPQAAGDYEIAITATNDFGAAEQRYWVSVFAAPFIVSQPTLSFLLGVPYHYDVDGLPATLGTAPLLWSLASGPVGMLVNGFTGEVVWTPEQAPPASVTLRVANEFGEDTQSFTITREGGVAPSIDGDANTQALTDIPFRYDADNHVDVIGMLPGENLEVLLIDGPQGFLVHPLTREVGWVPAVAGSYDVSLGLFTPGQFLLDQYDFSVTVESEIATPLQARATAVPVEGAAPLSVVFDGSGSQGTDGLPILQYAWDTNAGPVLRSAASGASYTYERPGGYMAVLEVWDSLGYYAKERVAVTVTDEGNLPPIALIEANRLAGEGELTVQFGCACTDEDGEISSILWQFGDGGTSGDSSPEHHFAQPGSYAVRLVVEDDQGLLAYDAATAVVTLRGLIPPTARIETTAIDGDGPLDVELHASAEDTDGVIESVRWTLPDGTLSSKTDIVVRMGAGESYTARLEVVDDDGLTGLDERTIVVRRDARRPPRIVSDPAVLASVGRPYAYDEDGKPSVQGDRPMVWSLGRVVETQRLNMPDGMVVDGRTGVVQWTPTSDQLGAHRITLQVDNGSGVDTQDFVVTVREMDAAADEHASSVSAGCACGQSASHMGWVWGFLILLISGRRSYALVATRTRSMS